MDKRVKLSSLDTLEILHTSICRHEFPAHYHETFCISLIEQGTFGENELIAPTGTLLISHPFEVHCNNLVNDIPYTFTTFYVNTDVMKSISKSENISFSNRIIDDPFLFNLFNSLTVTSSSKISNEAHDVAFEQSLFQGIEQLTNNFGIAKPFSAIEHNHSLSEVKHYVSQHLGRKIILDELAKIAGMNKYKFIRWFKKNVGLTPFDYIILNRIEQGKKMIHQGKPLTHIALDTGFYDQSNFSNYFKRFVGLSPNAYKETSNIFQDITFN